MRQQRVGVLLLSAVLATAALVVASAVPAAGAAPPKHTPPDQVVHISLVSCGGQGTACHNRTEEALVTIKSAALSTLRHRGSPALQRGERVYGLRFHMIADDTCTPGLVAGVERLYGDLIESGVVPSHFGYEFYAIDAVQPAHDDDAGSENGKKPDFRRLESNKPCAGQKLLVPYILPPTLDAVINLDTDLVVVDSLGKLWDSTFPQWNATHWFALCPEHATQNIAWYGRLSRHPFYPPFGLNSGVLPMNLTRVRTFDLSPDLSDPPRGRKQRNKTRKLLRQGKEHKVSLSRRYRADPYPLQAYFSDLNRRHYDSIVWGDQDLLNIFAHDHRHTMSLLPCAWNYRPDHCQYGHTCPLTATHATGPRDLVRDAERVGLLHGNRQVFHNGNMLPFRAVYDLVRDYNFRPNSKTGQRVVKTAQQVANVAPAPGQPDHEDCRKAMQGVLKQFVPKLQAWRADPDAAASPAAAATAAAAKSGDDEDDDDDADKGLDTMKGVSDDEDADADVAAAAKKASANKAEDRSKGRASVSGDDDPRLWGGDDDDDDDNTAADASEGTKKPAAAAAPAAPSKAAAAAAAAPAKEAAKGATKKSKAERAHDGDEDDDDDDDDDEDDKADAAAGEGVADANGLRLPYAFLDGDALAAAEAAGLADPMMHVFMIYTNSNPQRHAQFKVSVDSIFASTPMNPTDRPVTLHFCVDHHSGERAKEVLLPHVARVNGAQGAGSVAYQLHQIGDIERKLSGTKTLMKKMEQFFTSGGHVGGIIFFIGPLLQAILPSSVHRALQLDADIKVKTDLRVLWNRFGQFGPMTVMGLAYDQQPVYRHVLWKWRNAHRDTKIGNPPATGFAGYNSGVMLLQLDRMRTRHYASRVLNTTYVDQLTAKYSFKGHLGDQDWLTLVSAEKENRALFHLLPCGWNRQLCEYWKTGYAEVWDDYHGCPPPIHLWHGNCNSPFPPGE